MLCPNCEAALSDPSQDACPECNLSLKRLDEVCGALPRSQGALNDLQGVLTPRQKNRLRDYVAALGQEFLYCGFYLRFLSIPPSTPVKPYTWWMFNRLYAAPFSQGLLAYAFLVAIDAQRKRAVIMVSATAEKILSQEDLNFIIASGQHDLENGQAHLGARAILHTLRQKLVRVAKSR
ncbi:MAG: hypothetical protein ACFCU3_05190 [Verrucomicrobiales bacterium]